MVSSWRMDLSSAIDPSRMGYPAPAVRRVPVDVHVEVTALSGLVPWSLYHSAVYLPPQDAVFGTATCPSNECA